jgi:hypothetical protein
MSAGNKSIEFNVQCMLQADQGMPSSVTGKSFNGISLGYCGLIIASGLLTR